MVTFPNDQMANVTMVTFLNDHVAEVTMVTFPNDHVAEVTMVTFPNDHVAEVTMVTFLSPRVPQTTLQAKWPRAVRRDAGCDSHRCELKSLTAYLALSVPGGTAVSFSQPRSCATVAMCLPGEEKGKAGLLLARRPLRKRNSPPPRFLRGGGVRGEGRLRRIGSGVIARLLIGPPA